MIEAYRFGEMVIDGQIYQRDLIIYPERVDADWWRKTGHEVCVEDIQAILAAQPECLVVGTGKPGFMKVLAETHDVLNEQGIECIVAPTKQAYRTFNHEFQRQKRVIGAFHLTC